MTPFWIFFTLWLLAAPIHGTMAAEKNVDAAKLLALTQAPPSGSRLTLPPGTYRLCDQPGKGLLFRGWENKEIVAEGVTLILKPGQSFTLENCRNVRVRGLTIDCDPLPWSEATLTAIQSADQTATIQLEKGSPPLEDLPQRDSLLYFVFDPETLTPRPLLWEGFRKFHAEGQGRYRLGRPTAGHFFAEPDGPLGPKVGDKIALFNRGGPVFQVRESAGCQLEEVSVYASPGYAFYESGGDGGHRYLRCRITRKPESRRLLATAADGFHSYLVRQGPVLEECDFNDTADDTIAIHGFFSLVTGSRQGAALLVAPFGIDFAAGDTLRFLEIPHGRTIGSGRVTAVRAATPEETGPDLEKQLEGWAREGFRMRKIPQKKVWAVETDPPVALPPDQPVLASSTARCGNGAVVRNCVIRRSHKRGILVKADDVTIQGNTLEDVAGPSILIEPELFWLEGPLPKNVSIVSNTITRSSWRSLNRAGASLGLGGAIEIRTRLARRQFPPQQDPYPVMENFRIEGNTIRDSGAYALVLGNVRGATVAGNVMEGAFRRPGAAASRGLSQAFDAKDHDQPPAPDPAASPAAVIVFGSEDVELSGNKITTGDGYRDILIGPWTRDIRGADAPKSP